MNKSKRSSLKRVVLAAAVLLGCAAVAPAFARSHVSVGIGINMPGVSVGYSDGYYRPYYRPAYYAGYAAPVYYRPAPRVVYYDDPVVVERPVYVRRVYEERGYYSDGYRHRRYHDDDGD